MTQNNKTISIKDIAELTGVSTATVSRVLNNKGGYSKKTEEKIKNIIDEYGYVSNLAAKSIRVSKSFTIGLIVPNIQNEFYSNLSSSIEDFFYNKGYSVFICNSSNSIDKELDYFKRLESQSVDGIIDVTCQKAFSENTSRKNIPIVFLDRVPASNIDFPTVISNDYDGVCQSTQSLVDSGCKDIIFIDAQVGTIQNNRLTAYKDTLQKNKMIIDENKILRGNILDPSRVQGEIAVTEYLNSGRKVDGIICPSDSLAVGALYAVKRAGLKVPEDIKIIGFDNSIQSQITNPPISTISRSPELMAKKASQLLLDIIEENTLKEKHIIINTNLIIRSSSR